MMRLWRTYQLLYLFNIFNLLLQARLRDDFHEHAVILQHLGKLLVDKLHHAIKNIAGFQLTPCAGVQELRERNQPVRVHDGLVRVQNCNLQGSKRSTTVHELRGGGGANSLELRRHGPGQVAHIASIRVSRREDAMDILIIQMVQHRKAQLMCPDGGVPGMFKGLCLQDKNV
eukprot:CAMPEP_0181463640 /NCGR_PEP_ID=MMETSP1110-20121109/35017_1 /TAXON_ID=174948 /ORGANISM="Symbiodinium sp., Strain CCMP421" /LENGTH=171 /DNA_ID=CAMNT_0023588341 /DNA_START=136 /DNA_END=651 /DNA_ORIENTATION=+